MNIVIEPMTKEHIPQVAEIERQSFSMPWSKDAFLESLSYDYSVFLVALDYMDTDNVREPGCMQKKNRVLGYIGMYKSLNEGEITNVAVNPG